MAKLTKKQKLVAEKFELGKAYAVGEAVTLLSECASDRFAESFDIAVTLGVDPKKSDQAVRGATTLPHGSGKTVKVAVFAAGLLADEAEKAGADRVGMEDLVEDIKAGRFDFDVVISAPDAMKTVAPVSPILGPRGLMPNPKSGTVTTEIAKAVESAKSGQMQYRTDRAGVIHGSVGQVGQSPDCIKENIEAVIADLKKAKPASAKGIYLQKINLTTTMGRGVDIDQASLEL